MKMEQYDDLLTALKYMKIDQVTGAFLASVGEALMKSEDFDVIGNFYIDKDNTYVKAVSGLALDQQITQGIDISTKAVDRVLTLYVQKGVAYLSPSWVQTLSDESATVCEDTILKIPLADPSICLKIVNKTSKYFAESFIKWWEGVQKYYGPNSSFKKMINEIFVHDLSRGTH